MAGGMKKNQRKAPSRRKKIRAAVSGSGRMGRAVKKILRESPFMEAADFADTSRDPKMWAPEKIDGAIDFSLPPLFSKTLGWCLKNKKPFVSGTTGLSAAQKKRMKEAAKKIPVFYAENMSWGIFLLGRWLESLCGGDVDILLEDIHHKGKKDRPSGTALRLKGQLPPALRKRVRIKSVRRGSVFGTHRITAQAPEEALILEHRALSRAVFARGAARALLLLAQKQKGFYSLKDIYYELPL